MASAGPSVLVSIGGKVASSLNAAVATAKAKFTSLEKSVRTQQRLNEQNRESLRGQMVDAAALGAGLYATLKPAIEFESAMADIRKVVDFKDPEAGLAAMSDTIKDMARTIPISQKGLADIVGAGGRMGIAEGDLRSYAETVSKMATAWEMAPDQAGEAMAKVSNIMGLSIKDLSLVGDAINKLDDSSSAKASEILDVLKRTGGTAKQFGLTTQQIAALSTAFLDLGSSPEVAATGINAILNKLQAAPAQSKKFQAALKTVGWSAKGIQKDIGKDAQGTLNSFLEKLSGFDKIKQANLLAELFGAEYSDDVAKLIAGMDKYKQHLATVGDEANYAGSMEKEFAVRSQTTANQLQLSANLANELAINVGSALLPALNDGLKILGPLAGAVADFAKAHPFAIKAVVGTAAALMTLKIAAIGSGYAWTFVKGAGLTAASGMLKASGMVATVARTLTSASALMAVAGKVMRGALIGSGIGAILVGIGMAVAWIANNTGNLGIAWEAFKGAFERAIAPVRPAIDAVGGPLSRLAGWVMDLIGPVQGAEGSFARFGLVAGKVVGGLVVGVVNVATAIGDGIGMAVGGLIARFDAVRAAFDQGVIQGIGALFVNFNPVSLMMAGIEALRAYLSTIDLSASGAAIIDTIAAGVRAKADALVASVQGVLSEVRQYLPFSDAKTGPLSTLTYSGQALVGTIGEGVEGAGAGAIAKPLAAAFAGALSVLDTLGPAAADSVAGTAAPVLQASPAAPAVAESGGAAVDTRRAAGTLTAAIEAAAPALTARPAAPPPGPAPVPDGGAEDGRAARRAVDGMAATNALSAAASAGTAAIAGGAAPPAGAVTVSPTIAITVQGNADPAALADQIRAELERLIANAQADRRSALHD